MCAYCDNIKNLDAIAKRERLIWPLKNDIRPSVVFSNVPESLEEKYFGLNLQVVVERLFDYADFYCPVCGNAMIEPASERRLQKENETLRMRLAFNREYGKTHSRGRKPSMDL